MYEGLFVLLSKVCKEKSTVVVLQKFRRHSVYAYVH